MSIRLDDANILDYLVQHDRCRGGDTILSVKTLRGKNHNLLVKLAPENTNSKTIKSLLVKQQSLEDAGISKLDFQQEWRIHTLLSSHEELNSLRGIISTGLEFDPINGILIFAFLEQYSDLGEFYRDTHQFSTAIATALGISLATMHQATFKRQEYRLELDPESTDPTSDCGSIPDFHGELENLTPELFKRVSVDGLKFYKLYQQSDHFSQAIGQLEADYSPCCLIHNDLKFNNILLHRDWSNWQPSPLPASPSSLHLPEEQGIIRVIDWEQWAWGDPAFDVGSIVAEYLRLWLQSLMLSRDIEIALALQLATIPLEILQPSLTVFIQAYLAQFPQILEVFPSFVERVLRFAGLGLIEAIQERLHYREPFGNLEISMLQVAKSLLCQPAAAMMTVFGRTAFHPSDFDPLAVVSGVIAPISSTQGDDESPSEVPLPRWVHHYSRDDALADLVANIRLEPPLIEHPAYPSLDLNPLADGAPPERQCERYSSLPDDLRQTYLLRQVRNYLYDIYFSGEQERQGHIAPQTTDPKDKIVSGLDIDFFEQIQKANSGTGFFDPNWILIRTEDNRAQVEKDGLRLWVNPSEVFAIGEPSTGQLSNGDMAPWLPVGTPISLRLPNASLVGEYYMAIGNEGEPASDQTCINLFFNVSAEGAIILMDILTRALNRRAFPFTFKVLHKPLSYGRFNSAILNLERTYYTYLRLVLQEHYSGLRSHLRYPIPLFTQPLAPGIGLAESPEDENDFGLGRCQILAQALLISSPTPRSRQWTMQQQFAQHNLDWQRPHLNPASGVQYPTLDDAVPQQGTDISTVAGSNRRAEKS